MRSKKEKRTIRSANDHAIRKKVISPKLDILRPSHQPLEKKPVIGENKIKNIPKNV